TAGSGLVVANPVAEEDQVDAELHDRVLRESLEAAEAQGIRGKAVTPFLLERFHRETGGASLRSNVAIILGNAALAARIAVAAAGPTSRGRGRPRRRRPPRRRRGGGGRARPAGHGRR